MGLFSAKKSTSPAHGSKPPTQPPKAPAYVVESQIEPAHRTPTDSSYYDFNGQSAGGRSTKTWMYARDARAQQAKAPTQPKSGRAGYPSYFGNKDPSTPLTVPQESIPYPNAKSGQHAATDGWLHNPLIPDRQQTYRNTEYKYKGAVRSVYGPSDPNKFDVIYHNDTKPFGQFSTATYYPARAHGTPR